MLVVVGGQCRKAGKTSVLAALIGATRETRWTAIKISTHAHDTPDGFALTEETRPGSGTDTARYLLAGAERSWWLRGSLEPAREALAELLRASVHAIVESNSVLSLVTPDLYVVVFDSAANEIKPSARRFLHRADIVVLVDRGRPPLVELPVEVPLFAVQPDSFESEALLEFFRRRVAASHET